MSVKKAQQPPQQVLFLGQELKRKKKFANAVLSTAWFCFWVVVGLEDQKFRAGDERIIVPAAAETPQAQKKEGVMQLLLCCIYFRKLRLGRARLCGIINFSLGKTSWVISRKMEKKYGYVLHF